MLIMYTPVSVVDQILLYFMLSTPAVLCTHVDRVYSCVMCSCPVSDVDQVLLYFMLSTPAVSCTLVSYVDHVYSCICC